MTDGSTITLANLDDERTFSVGMRFVFTEKLPWWKRLCRWLTRYKPTEYVITSLDAGSGEIVIGCDE